MTRLSVSSTTISEPADAAFGPREDRQPADRGLNLVGPGVSVVVDVVAGQDQVRAGAEEPHAAIKVDHALGDEPH